MKNFKGRIKDVIFISCQFIPLSEIENFEIIPPLFKNSKKTDLLLIII